MGGIIGREFPLSMVAFGESDGSRIAGKDEDDDGTTGKSDYTLDSLLQDVCLERLHGMMTLDEILDAHYETPAGDRMHILGPRAKFSGLVPLKKFLWEEIVFPAKDEWHARSNAVQSDGAPRARVTAFVGQTHDAMQLIRELAPHIAAIGGTDDTSDSQNAPQVRVVVCNTREALLKACLQRRYIARILDTQRTTLVFVLDIDALLDDLETRPLDAEDLLSVVDFADRTLTHRGVHLVACTESPANLAEFSLQKMYNRDTKHVPRVFARLVDSDIAPIVLFPPDIPQRIRILEGAVNAFVDSFVDEAHIRGTQRGQLDNRTLALATVRAGAWQSASTFRACVEDGLTAFYKDAHIGKMLIEHKIVPALRQSAFLVYIKDRLRQLQDSRTTHFQHVGNLLNKPFRAEDCETYQNDVYDVAAELKKQRKGTAGLHLTRRPLLKDSAQDMQDTQDTQDAQDAQNSARPSKKRSRERLQPSPVSSPLRPDAHAGDGGRGEDAVCEGAEPPTSRPRSSPPQHPVYTTHVTSRRPEPMEVSSSTAWSARDENYTRPPTPAIQIEEVA